MRQRLARLVMAAGVAATAGLAFAAPASAAAPNTPSTPWLNQTLGDKSVTASSATDQCAETKKSVGADLDPAKDYWVFVWEGDQAGTLVDLQLTFDEGTRTEADATKTSDSGTTKYWVSTPAGWTLNDGTSQITGTVPTQVGGSDGTWVFQLTHSCAGTPSTGTPSPSTTSSPEASGTPSPGSSESTQPGGSSPSASPSSGGGLPVTGVAWGATVLTAVGLIAAGVALMAVRRRRELTEDTSAEA
jgi:hypothetical protein